MQKAYFDGAIHRHTGGLEMASDVVEEQTNIHRHTGGLEKDVSKLHGFS